MAVTYNKLWKLLIDKKMNKTQLCEKVRVEVLARICTELGCTLDEIVDILPEKGEKEDTVWT